MPADQLQTLLRDVQAATLRAVQAAVYLRERFVGEDDANAEAASVVVRRNVRKLID